MQKLLSHPNKFIVEILNISLAVRRLALINVQTLNKSNWSNTSVFIQSCYLIFFFIFVQEI